ncbi:hypothetical protein NDU88_002088 [Pleurodeles waltl]|uniref:Uncharacterized protein n=1 Tax=Pleurodeles waltl TaxID=8319 RepID=A0AAV7NCM6_PLEWA|nr:hypothetical protein NDU88_002088 [Pleurodeles waltl]
MSGAHPGRIYMRRAGSQCVAYTAGQSAESGTHPNLAKYALIQAPGRGMWGPPQLNPLTAIQPAALATRKRRGHGPLLAELVEGFKDFMKGSQVTHPVQQLIALRNLIGTEVGQIIKELLTDTASTYQGVCEVLYRKFLHKRNIDYERYSFNLASQENDESMVELIS